MNPSSKVETQRLDAQCLHRAFSGGAGVHGVNLAVAPGEIRAIVGLNGAGKTTIMRLLLGMLRPDVGTVRIDGIDIRTRRPSIWLRVGHFVEHPLVYAELDCRSNLEIAARLHGVAPQHIEAVVTRAIREYHLSPYASVRANRLSLGNRQRVGLAAALAHDPTLIVLDEPTNALDPSGVILLRESLRRRAAAGAGILVSSHHLDEVARVADRITVVNQGQLIGELDPENVDLERSFFELVHRNDSERRYL